MDPNAPRSIGGPLWELARLARQMRALLALPKDLQGAERDAAIRAIVGDEEADRVAATPPPDREEVMTLLAEAIFAVRGETPPANPAAAILAELEAEAKDKVVPLRDGGADAPDSSDDG